MALRAFCERKEEVKKDTISFSFCISDNYAQHLSVVLASMLVNNPDEDFVFHVVHHSVTPASEAKLRELETLYPRHRIVFHKIDEAEFADLPLPSTCSHITREAYYRLILPRLLPSEPRTIYSDVDVLCLGKIRPLWETDLGGNLVAAISEHRSSRSHRERMRELGMSEDADYACSGLLVMDLDRLRAENAVPKFFATAMRLADKLVFADQDVLNVVCDKRIKILPDEFHCSRRYSPFARDPVMWHFKCQTQKPWCCLWKNITWWPYAKYLRLTPYRDNLAKLVWSHLKGFFWFSYVKNRRRRWLCCGIRVWRRKEP